MKNFFSKLFLDPIFTSLLTVVAGVLITIFYSMAISIICTLIGCIAALFGIMNIIKYFRAPIDSKLNLFTGLVFGALGISVIINPDSLSNFVAVVFGIIILYQGIVNFQSALVIKRSGYSLWYLSLIFALVTILAGILLIVLKGVIGQWIATVIGVTLIIEGLLNTWTAIKVKKANE